MVTFLRSVNTKYVILFFYKISGAGWKRINEKLRKEEG
jgi:hypothetical protein